MSSLLEPRAAADTRRIYSQNNAARELLSPANWEVVPLAEGLPGTEGEPFVVIADDPSAFTAALRQAVSANQARVLYLLRDQNAVPPQASGTPIFSFLTSPIQSAILTSLLRAAFDNLDLARSQGELRQQLAEARGEIDELNQIGIALSAQRDTAALLDLILRKSREITTSDAGSLYLIEESESGDKRLRFKLAQNDSLQVPFEEFTMPINSSSFAGYVALTGEDLHVEDCYHSPAELQARHNPRFDREVGYYTKSMLVVAMKNPQGEIIGVVQLINSKRNKHLRVSPTNVNEVVIPYPAARRALVSSLASQAAVAIENARLVENIEKLFEGFVKASVVAIESRDPTTSGHSFRVADLTVGLAEAVDRCDTYPFRDIGFSRSEMKEIRYASLLHDFGKVGVREEVLVKAKKLYPLQIELVKNRFDFVRKALQQEHTERKLQYTLEKGRDELVSRQGEFDADFAKQLAELDEFLKFILQCNEPTVLPEGNFLRLTELAERHFQSWDGELKPLLSPDEARMLAIPKGSLDEEERLQIESHVIHSFNFLSQIPWTKEIKNIPLIARAHHEKLNGSGYPYKLSEEEIPFQSKMMTISDIYDALSATDRPYKRALTTERSLDILSMEANQKLIDNTLFKLFVESEVYKKTIGWKHSAAV